MRINLLLAISGLFSSQQDQIRSLILSILSAIVLGIPHFLIEKLFKSKNKFVKLFAIFLFISVLLVSLYATLVVSALMGVDQSNQWAISYLFSFITEFSFITPFSCLLKVKIFKSALVSSFCLFAFLKKILGKQILEIVDKLNI